MSGLNVGPQYRRLDALRAGEPFGESLDFVDAGFARSTEAKSRNILLLTAAQACWLYRRTPSPWLRERVVEHVETVAAAEALEFMGSEPGSTTYQPHHLNALYAILDACEGVPALKVCELAARTMLSRHLLWCALFATPDGVVMAPGRRCGIDVSRPLTDWYTATAVPQERNWKRMRTYEWRRSPAYLRHEPLAGAQDLRTRDTFRLVRCEWGHVATMGASPGIGHPPPIWGVKVKYNGSLPQVWRTQGSPYADDVAGMGSVLASVTIDSDGVHRG